METKFTKGEWVGITVTTPNGFFERVTIKDGESICNVTTRNSKRAKANAKLIAAAPELLEALNDLIGKLNFICLDAEYMYSNELEKCEQAIKKATE